MAILALLAGLLSFMARQSMASAQTAKARSDIKQIGLAVLMYRESEGGYPPSRLDPVVKAGYLKDVSILKVSSDPYRLGYARQVYDCGMIEEAEKTKLVTSYEDVFVWDAKQRKNIWLDDMIRPIDPGPALVVTRVFGVHEGVPDEQCGPKEETSFMGKTIRFHEDGSVRTYQFWDGDPGLRNRFCWPALFSNLPPDVVCERHKYPPRDE
jgi:hypothetical protein